MMVGWRCGAEEAVGDGVERWIECEAAGQVGGCWLAKRSVVIHKKKFKV